MRNLNFLALSFLLPVCVFAQTQPPYQGRVIGTIVDDAGRPFPSSEDANRPFPNAIVCFAQGHEHPRPRGCSPSDSHGHFDIRVPLETDRVYAEKPEAGYMEDEDLTKAGVAVNLSQADPTAHIVLKIGPKPAQLTFRVKGQETDKAIEGFRVKWIVFNDDPPLPPSTPNSQARDLTNGIRFTYLSRKNQVSVPSNRDVLVWVHVPGYKHWFYVDAAHGSQPFLRFQPGEKRMIEVDLQALATQN